MLEPGQCVSIPKTAVVFTKAGLSGEVTHDPNPNTLRSVPVTLIFDHVVLVLVVFEFAVLLEGVHASLLEYGHHG